MRCVGRQARKLRVTEMKQRLVIAGRGPRASLDDQSPWAAGHTASGLSQSRPVK